MFKRSFASKGRASKAVRPSKRSFLEQQKVKLQQHLDSFPDEAALTSPIITFVVGRESRLFACHEDILLKSPYFAAMLKDHFYDGAVKRFELPNEEPEVFSSVLEYLYKGDYYPRLLHDKKRNTFSLEDATTPKNHSGRSASASTVYHTGVDGVLLKDSVIYCTADKFGLEPLKRLALRKQGLQMGIQVDVILRTARYAYDNTPDHDAKLRAHFLALIIRSRKVFKRSGTMQMEMELGGSKLFFDLFVSMCNHFDDIVDLTNKASPRTI